MTTIFAEQVLTSEGWRKNMRLSVQEGKIVSLEPDTAPAPGDDVQAVVLPAMANLHSHAFQRGMAGLAELRGPTADSFWSWRNVMYHFALSMSPEQMEAIAAQLYVEMLEAGFCRVGEFHYLHHDRDGRPYANLAEMAERIVAATDETGIELTLLPVFYAHSGFGGLAPVEGQRRFINDLGRFAALLDACQTLGKDRAAMVTGIAPHSLRAVTPEELRALTALPFDGPIHIHAAEQVKEVDDSLAWSGQRPIEWLLDHAELSERWCLIHATHMTEVEVTGMARSGAIAGLCPITEANLGDGIFPAPGFLDAGGRFGVGSDSNVLIGLTDELRQLEYSQRLGSRARNVVAESGGSSGRRLFDGASAGGAAALRCETGIAEGRPANLVSLSMQHPIRFEGDRLLDSWIFANGASVDSVWVAGRKLVESGRHIRRDAVAHRFRKAMGELLAEFAG
ncbi:formimidoylglutamate deiminase [Neorhizobium lilium]|uniref:Formimidoylglutamate deiminase n=1 Tax=Neorhizobium lilium TaxID=2503024 RepID=A0A3S3VES6_9HYPH|nr:formimidoylglutamate deiminase [Neorhizobium lilium]RWX75000.1 formimidoylglutamate deiminase [Neorhizobium lilium]